VLFKPRIPVPDGRVRLLAPRLVAKGKDSAGDGWEQLLGSGLRWRRCLRKSAWAELEMKLAAGRTRGFFGPTPGFSRPSRAASFLGGPASPGQGVRPRQRATKEPLFQGEQGAGRGPDRLERQDGAHGVHGLGPLCGATKPGAEAWEGPLLRGVTTLVEERGRPYIAGDVHTKNSPCRNGTGALRGKAIRKLPRLGRGGASGLGVGGLGPAEPLPSPDGPGPSGGPLAQGRQGGGARYLRRARR